MPLAERRAKHRDHVVDAGLSGGEAVGVAFDHDRPTRRRHRLAGGVEPVEH